MDYSDTLQPNLIINSQVPGVVHLAVIDSNKYQANNGQIDSTSMGRIGILPLGHIYTLSFYYYTSLLSSPEEYSRFSVSYDNGSTWSEWTYLSPDSEAWSLVSVEIPDYQHQFKLKVAAKHSGTSKYAHWDSFYLSREVAPPQPPSVFNVQIAQRTDGSGLVDIYYDLFDANNDLSTIALLVSDNAGTSYEVIPSPANLSGDIGADILSTANKRIVWNVGTESINYGGDQYKFRLLAEDNTYPPLALPTFTPEAGGFICVQSVSISCAILGATTRIK